MVKLALKTYAIVVACLLGWMIAPGEALALFTQTGSDLEVLRDAITFELEISPGLIERATPILLATPLHHWRESKTDFAAAATKVLAEVFNRPGAIINCPDCNNWRLKVADGGALLVNNGELSLAELERLRHEKSYEPAKSLALIEETPAGVAFKLVSLQDGQILMATLADSTAKLSKVQPYLHLQQEKERRLRGEALSYVFINLGLYPQGLFQIEFLEQWGSRNQFITGLGLSLVNPDFSLGLVTHYMIPRNEKLQVVGGVYFPLQKALSTNAGSFGGSDATLHFQAMIEYAIGPSFGVFAGVSSEGRLSAGFNLYNPLFMPFLL